jgi:hypothetical protein
LTTLPWSFTGLDRAFEESTHESAGHLEKTKKPRLPLKDMPQHSHGTPLPEMDVILASKKSP